MTEKQRVLVIIDEKNRLLPHFSSLQERLNRRDYGFALKRLDISGISTAPTQTLSQMGQHLSQRNYDLVLAPIEPDLSRIIRQHYNGMLGGYAYSACPRDDEAYDELLRFANLRDFSDGLVRRIQEYLRKQRS